MRIVAKAPLTSFEPDKIVAKAPLTGFEPDKIVADAPLTGFEPDKIVAKAPLAGFEPDKIVAKAPLTGFEPDKIVAKAPLAGFELVQGDRNPVGQILVHDVSCNSIMPDVGGPLQQSRFQCTRFTPAEQQQAGSHSQAQVCQSCPCRAATMEMPHLRLIYSVMTPPTTLIVYTDYKSPYAFLAKDRVYALAAETGAEID